MLGIGVCLGCGGGIPLETVPSDPIAFVRQEAAKGQLSLDVFREGLQFRAFEEAGNKRRPPAPHQSIIADGPEWRDPQRTQRR